jgi:hypothetical protein
MKRLFEPLLWFILIPYFFVGGLNARPWFSESREFANRTNAQLTLALILIWPLILLSPRAGPVKDAIDAYLYLIAGLILILALWLVSAWLKGDREQKYAAAYGLLPKWWRIAFGISTPILMMTSLLIGASNAPANRAPQLRCDHSATEVTADACTTR